MRYTYTMDDSSPEYFDTALDWKSLNAKDELKVKEFEKEKEMQEKMERQLTRISNEKEKLEKSQVR